MRARFLTAILTGIILTGLVTSPAEAATGPRRLQRLAALQTKLLFRYYHGQPQTASPPTCGNGHDDGAPDRVLVLPTLSFGAGNATFTCDTAAKTAVLDLGGAIATEDKRGDTYTLADGATVTFTRKNLPRICDDVTRFYSAPAPATFDNHALTGTEVTTNNFTVTVNPDANNTPGSPYFQDSIDLGHPGRLTACYGGWKTVIPLTPGQHVIHVDLTADATPTGTPTHFTYKIHVERDH